MEAQAEEFSAEAQKEKKLRERSEQYSRQLEEELEGMKVCVHKHTFSLKILLRWFRNSATLPAWEIWVTLYLKGCV